MKLGIVTLPFNWNYGGILQNFALQWTLKQMGHEPLTLNRIDKVKVPLKQKVILLGKRFLLKFVFRRDISLRSWPKEEELNIIKQHTDRFIKEHIDTTEVITNEKKLNDIDKFNFEAVIVGSDQVWRPKYSPRIENHFLDFINEKSKVKRISFAASFGTDEWEYSPKQTEHCSKLAKQFDSLSVREDSGVKLCKDNLKVDAQVTLDPTLLVPKEEYIKLVEKDKIDKLPGTLFNYVLDSTSEKNEVITKISNKLGLDAFSSTASQSFFKVGKKRINECIFPPVTRWLRAFMDAEFVVTDSFHGTAFSIIFNKQFVALGNTKRGLTRFKSILKIFNLENRLLDENNLHQFEEVIDNKIDYEKVNKTLNEERSNSMEFLRKSLT